MNNNNDNNYDDFDDRAFAAGRSLQESAPEGGLARVRSSYRRRRVATIGAAGVSVLLIGVGVFALSRRGNDADIAELPTDTMPSVAPTTGAPSTSEVTVTVPETSAAPAPTTTEAPEVTTTTAAQDAPVATPPPATTTTAPAQPVGNAYSGAPVLFWEWSYLGEWGSSGFDNPEQPAGLIGSTITLTNLAGETYTAEVVECDGHPTLSPLPPEKSNYVDNYWFTPGAPFKATPTNDDSTLQAMNDALTAKGLDPARAGSVGGNLSADGSVDRLMWYDDANGYTMWVATFNADTGEFTTHEGDPVNGTDTDVGHPDVNFTDLDGDGNLESGWGLGDSFHDQFEWATGDAIAYAGFPCPDLIQSS